MTENVQVIDRYIGIQYKDYVYLCIRRELTKRLKAARVANGGADGVIIPSLTPREKRILITHAIGEFHEKITKSDAFERANVATGTWMPVSHCIAEDGPSNLPVDSEVSIQHLKEYDYAKECSREKILSAVDEHNKANEEAHNVKKHIAEEEAKSFAADNELSKPYNETAMIYKSEIESALSVELFHELRLIVSETEFKECLIGGSYVSRALARVTTKVFQGDSSVDVATMVANDIDVYHGTFGDGKLKVFRNCIHYIDNIDGLDVPINTVKCSNISAESFLSNNDLNATASCIHITALTYDSAGDKRVKFALHVRPQLWHLLLCPNSEKRIEVVNQNVLDNPATTCVRAAYKSMQMKIKLNLDKLGDPVVGTLAKSQKTKLDEMEGWADYPFVEYRAKKVRGHFVLVKKSSAIVCMGCAKRGNAKCSNRMCKGCCIMLMSKRRNTVPCRAKCHDFIIAAYDARYESQVKEGQKGPSVAKISQEFCLPVGIPALPPICFPLERPAPSQTCCFLIEQPVTP